MWRACWFHERVLCVVCVFFIYFYYYFIIIIYFSIYTFVLVMLLLFSRVKPDIVFFGEELPERFLSLVDMDVSNCDLLLVLGTSLQVYPVASIPQSANCPVVLINRENVAGKNMWTGET
mmetsp:Transcript_17495/g.24909  ORF Transcript_17495/g.24909 Transcript_17495/m.24909 type:complete len:119 (+) Transcript_17495:42-398(+)